MQRLDPQDAGPAYRNVVGLPGGVNSPLFKILEVIWSRQLSFSFKYHGNVKCQIRDVTELQKKNIHGMKLVAGEGNVPGQLKEDDRIGVIYVLVSTFSLFFICLHLQSPSDLMSDLIWMQDSSQAPFHLAEQYHQFHNGIGIPFGPEYTKRQKQVAQRMRRIGPTGCPEIGGLFG